MSRSIFLILFVTSALLAEAATLYVDADATGADDGSSWTNAYADLQDALAAATQGDEVWIAEGTYFPSNLGTTNYHLATFSIPAGVRVYGGFAGSETNREDRDPAVNPVILSADYNGDDVVTRDPTTGELTFANISENGRTVVTFNGTVTVMTPNPADATYTVLDCVTIQGGNGGSGAGIYVNGINGASNGGLASPAISNVTLQHNLTTGVGGGAFVRGTANPLFTNVTFFQNKAASGGGASMQSGSNPTVTNCTFFQNNVSLDGGAVQLSSSPGSPVFINVVFAQNAAYATGSTTTRGGAAYIQPTSTTDPVFSNVTFVDNTAAEAGGALFIQASSSGSPSVTVDNSILWGNVADFSSDYNQIFNQGSVNPTNLTVRNSVVQGGTSVIFGVTASNVILVNPSFVDRSNPNGADGIPRTNDDGLTLLPSSPAINLGDNALIQSGITTDILGGDRILQSTVDAGAYEQEGTLPSIYHVDGDVTTSGDGLSWATAFKTLQEALTVAAAEDEVWIAAGTYVPSTTADRDASFRISWGVRVFGGFSGTETERSARDSGANLTILSGDYSSDDVVTRNAITGELTFTNNDENAYQVVYMDGTTSSGGPMTSDPADETYTILDGVTIRGGNANAVDFSAEYLGGIYGGGIYLDGRDGGTCSPVVSNVTVMHNVAGALANSGGGGGAFVLSDGGGTASPVFDQVTFWQNKTISTGGAVYIWSSSTDAQSGTSDVLFRNVSFIQNMADEAGAVSVKAANWSGTGNTMLAEASFVNAAIIQNVARNTGGVLGSSNGDGVKTSEVNISFSNSTVASNVATIESVGASAGGVDLRVVRTITGSGGSQTFEYDGSMTVENSILWGNTAAGNPAQFGIGRSGPYIFTNCIIQGGLASAPNTTGTNVIDEDPRFIDGTDPLGPDGLPQTSDDGIALEATSPAIDAGNDALVPSGITTDITGADRIQLTAVDIGAYEADATRTTTYVNWATGSGLTPGTNAGYGQTPGSDGIANLLKFAFDLDPLASATSALTVTDGSVFTAGLPVTVIESNPFDFGARFVRRKDYASISLVYIVEFSADLITWFGSTAIPTVVSDEGGDFQVVEVPCPANLEGAETGFFRIQIYFN